MICQVAEHFVDVVIEDSWLTNPADLLASMRASSERKPAEASLAVADALSPLDDAEALLIIQSTLDAAYFSIFNLLDAGMKKSGMQVEIGDGAESWKSGEFPVPFYEIYRDRVDPHGARRKQSS